MSLCSASVEQCFLNWGNLLVGNSQVWYNSLENNNSEFYKINGSSYDTPEAF